MGQVINWNQWGYDQKDVFAFSLSAFFCAIVLIMSYYISPQWKNELGGSKKIILVMSVYSLLHAIAMMDVYAYKPRWSCAVQAAMIQFFGVGSIMYQAALSGEIYYVIRTLIAGAGADNRPYQAATASRRRLCLFHCSINVFNAIAVCIIVLGNNFAILGYVDFLCYVRTQSMTYIFFVGPLVLTVLCMGYLTGLIIHGFTSLFQAGPSETQIQQRSSSYSSSGNGAGGDGSVDRGGGTHEDANVVGINDGTIAATAAAIMTNNMFMYTFKRLPLRGQHTIIRLLVLPLLFGIIAAVTLVYHFSYFDSSQSGPAIASACGSISGPLVNAVVWVFSDRVVLREWWNYLTWASSSRSVFRGTEADTTFEGPLSEYGGEHVLALSSMLRDGSFKTDGAPSLSSRPVSFSAPGGVAGVSRPSSASLWRSGTAGAAGGGGGGATASPGAAASSFAVPSSAHSRGQGSSMGGGSGSLNPLHSIAGTGGAGESTGGATTAAGNDSTTEV